MKENIGTGTIQARIHAKHLKFINRWLRGRRPTDVRTYGRTDVGNYCMYYSCIVILLAIDY